MNCFSRCFHPSVKQLCAFNFSLSVLFCVALFTRQHFYSSLNDDKRSGHAPNISAKNVQFEWREIFTGFYVYSLRYTTSHDGRHALHAVTIGNATDEVFWNTTTCFCAYGATDKNNQSINQHLRFLGELQRLPESHRYSGLTWTAARLKCPFPEAAQTFGYVTLQCRYERFPGGSSSGSVTLACPEVPRSPPTNLTFAHCGPPLHTNYDRPAVIVEFVEYYRLMGVTKFYEYDFDTSKNTKAVLNYYKKEGIMEVTNWNLPDVVGRGIHYFGQIALLYDCLLKSSLTHDYTVFSDFDEQFATAKVPATFESIMNSGRIDCSYVRSALMYPKPRRVDRIEGGNPLLRSAKRIFRETEIFKSGARSKYICRGRLIDVPLIHYVRKFKFKDDVMLDDADPENTLLLHFRSLPHELVNITAETRTLVHVASLKRNVFQIWKNIFGSA